MMKLSQAAAYFNTTPFADAYDPTVTFKGRLAAYDDNARDSLSTERRMLAVAPGVAIPPRRVVAVGGFHYIVGQGAADFHGAEELRNKFVLHRADELARVATFAEALQDGPGQSLWAGRLWVKEIKEPEESSALTGSYQIYFSQAEDIRDPAWAAGVFTDGREDNVLVHIAGKWHLVRDTLVSPGGLLVAVADELPEPVLLDVTYTHTEYDRRLDRRTPTTKTIRAVNLRWQSSFTYLHAYSANYQPGDIQLVVLKMDAAPATGDEFVVRGTKYKVVTALDQNLCWSVHLRHA